MRIPIQTLLNKSKKIKFASDFHNKNYMFVLLSNDKEIRKQLSIEIINWLKINNIQFKLHCFRIAITFSFRYRNRLAFKS